MQVICSTSFDELTPYIDDWERLAGKVPFRSWTWLQQWQRHYGPGDSQRNNASQLMIFCVFDGKELVGVAPWYLEKSTLGGRVLRQLGTAEVCSDYLGILCRADKSEAVIAALAEHLMQASTTGESYRRWDFLLLEGVDAEDAATIALTERLAEAGCLVHRRPAFNCWRLNLPPDWDGYCYKLLNRKRRHEIRSLERKWLESGKAVLHTVERVDELTTAFELLIELHQRRRRMLGEKGCFASPRFRAFFCDVMPELFRQGRLHLYWLEVYGKVAAAECDLIGGDTLYAYQVGMEPELLFAQPGKVLNIAILRRAIESGYRVMDFLRGDEIYKARFGATPRPAFEFRIAYPRALAKFRHHCWSMGSDLKRWAKQHLRYTPCCGTATFKDEES